jgi:hypothetical protein
MNYQDFVSGSVDLSSVPPFMTRIEDRFSQEKALFTVSKAQRYEDSLALQNGIPGLDIAEFVAAALGIPRTLISP